MKLELAEAIESRAFGAKKHRTNLYILKLKRADYIAFLISFTLLFIAIYIHFNIPIPEIQIPLP